MMRTAKTKKPKRKPLAAKSLSMDYMQVKRGYTVGDTERFVRREFKGRPIVKTFDLYGVFDFQAFNDELTIGVQVTVTDRWAEHRRLIEQHANVARWCKAPGRCVELHIWERADHVLHHRHRLRRFRYRPDDCGWTEIEVKR